MAKEQEDGKIRKAITKYSMKTGGGRGLPGEFFFIPYPPRICYPNLRESPSEMYISMTNIPSVYQKMMYWFLCLNLLLK
jgi:hypothetical protein